MMLKVMLPAYVPISEELHELVSKYYATGKLACCQDIQEATEPNTKLSREANALRNEYGQFMFKIDSDE